MPPLQILLNSQSHDKSIKSIHHLRCPMPVEPPQNRCSIVIQYVISHSPSSRAWPQLQSRHVLSVPRHFGVRFGPVRGWLLLSATSAETPRPTAEIMIFLDDKTDKKWQKGHTLSIVLGVLHPAPLKFPHICVVTMFFLKHLLGDVFSELHIGGISKPGRYLEFGLRFPTKKHIRNAVKHASLRHWKLDPYQSTILFCIPLSSSFQIYEWTNGSSLTTCNLEKNKHPNTPEASHLTVFQQFTCAPKGYFTLKHAQPDFPKSSQTWSN